MKDLIDAASWRAILFNEDGATRTYYENLRQHRLTSTRCQACGYTSFPPRLFCPRCQMTEVVWSDLPERGSLYAFTCQSRSLRFPAPDVIGLIDFLNCDRVLALLDGRLEDLAIGMTMALGFHQVSENLTVPCFKPIR